MERDRWQNGISMHTKERERRVIWLCGEIPSQLFEIERARVAICVHWHMHLAQPLAWRSWLLRIDSKG